MATIISSHKSAKKERKKRNQEKITEETFEMRKPIKFDIQKVETIVRALCVWLEFVFIGHHHLLFSPQLVFTRFKSHKEGKKKKKKTLLHTKNHRGIVIGYLSLNWEPFLKKKMIFFPSSSLDGLRDL